jgi:hypothetical protein
MNSYQLQILVERIEGNLPADPEELAACIGAIEKLKAQRKRLLDPIVRFIPDPDLDHVFWIDGADRFQVNPRTREKIWGVFMALRDGDVDVAGLGSATANSMRAGIKIIAEKLEQAGHRALAAEVRRISVGSTGIASYRQTPRSPRIIFE